ATTAKGVTSYEVDHLDNARYFVRSVDPAGNYSQTTAVASVGVVTPTEPTTPAEPTQPTEPTTPAEPTSPKACSKPYCHRF
ncbi:MAG: hypothetical protein Q3974_08780, partial [Rothia sp. (in: high G+C Gram-positive bacteria)]|nr:hypothetical protein [Rothia sp. (in: high G+C Gram-positive bacteria)]